MRAFQKLIRNGSSTQVTIPRPILIRLGWLCGDNIIIELLENDTVIVRKPVADDFSVRRSVAVLAPRSTTGIA